MFGSTLLRREFFILFVLVTLSVIALASFSDAGGYKL